jgi:hypothetical protein
MKSSVLFAVLSLTLSTSAMAGDKVDVCKLKGNGDVFQYSVSINALDGQLQAGAWEADLYYLDADGDGYGGSATTGMFCEEEEAALASFVPDGTDIDDSDPNVWSAGGCDPVDPGLGGLDEPGQGGDGPGQGGCGSDLISEYQQYQDATVEEEGEFEEEGAPAQGY